MAFSMLCRGSGSSSGISKQVLRLASQPSLQRPMNSLPVKSLAVKEANTTPLLNALRSFRTSAIRMSQEKGHDHSKLWVIEKAVSAAMIPLLPIGLLMPNKLVDSLLAILITAHSFWGLEAIAVDYVRASVVGPILPKVAIGLVYLLSIATLGGLFYIISHDIGICNSIRQFWVIKSHSA